jgi:tetratricopeptide (TPR) repeat protein
MAVTQKTQHGKLAAQKLPFVIGGQRRELVGGCAIQALTPRFFIDILNSWAYAYYYLGKFGDLLDLFRAHQVLAESIDEEARLGMFYAWLGEGLFLNGSTTDSYEYLCKALELGEKTGSQKVVGHSCAWLTWVCADLGLFAEGIQFGEKAQKIAEFFPSDQYIFFKSLGGICFIYFHKGDTKRIFKGAKRLLEYGERNANSRSKVFGHWMQAFGYWCFGDMKLSQESSEKGVQVALDPAYVLFPKATLGIAYFLEGRFREL